MTSPHRLVNPASLAAPSGFSHAVVAAPGTVVYLGGQTAHDHNGSIAGGTVAEQFDVAASNVVAVLAAAGAAPEHLVQVHIFVTDAAAYRASLEELGALWRKHFRGHYPAIALFEISALFDPCALIELTGIAVVPHVERASGG